MPGFRNAAIIIFALTVTPLHADDEFDAEIKRHTNAIRLLDQQFLSHYEKTRGQYIARVTSENRKSIQALESQRDRAAKALDLVSANRIQAVIDKLTKTKVDAPLPTANAIQKLDSARAKRDETATKDDDSGRRKVNGIFDGSSLNGWIGDSRVWTVRDGMIVGTTPAGGLEMPTYLIYEKPHRNFELSMAIRLTGDDPDTGLMVRSLLLDRNRFYVQGPQVNVKPGKWCDLVIKGGKTGPLRNKMLKQQNRKLIERALRAAEFNTVYVKCVGRQVKIKLNSVTLVDSEFAELPLAGVLAIQFWPTAGTSQVLVKDVDFREL
ncbi:3-keto-disaccharide hydrolase [Neorhodopirellula lusitana]|uniref:3-keto-disaccharide hydrolase n=1 Tax=Neorhodopirellula lusitana TaxID=445327 RepID=UPI00384E1794